MPDSNLSLEVPFWAWVAFGGVILVSLLVDLVAHRGGHGLCRKHAIAWSVAWISVALLFGGWVALQFGHGAALDFVTAYLIEKTLSIDNLFVFMVLFDRLRIPDREQHRVLFWGILGALVSRAVFIAAGAALLTRWHGAIYVLGAFLIFTGVKTARAPKPETGEGRLLPFLRRHLPFTPRLHGHRFLVIEDGRRVATPLLLALLVIEVTDVLFAVDSVPAVFAVSQDPFIVYSSNVFAILGLRALYLVLATLLKDLKYLHYALAAILIFAGAKMLTSSFLHVPHAVSLIAIVIALAAAVVPSLIARRAARSS
jgi:tellurite resistance protein TerC